MKRPQVLLLPLIAVMAGIQRRAFLETPTGSRVWQYVAGVSLLGFVVALLVATLTRVLPLASRRVSWSLDWPLDLRGDRKLVKAGTSGLLLPMMLTAWASARTAHTFTVLLLLVPLLALHRGVKGPRSVLPLLLVSAGVVFLSLGKVAGLGLGFAPSMYFVLTVGGVRPGPGTLLGVAALVSAAVLTARFLRTFPGVVPLARGGRSAALLLAPCVFVLSVFSFVGGYLPVVNFWTLAAGAAIVATLLAFKALIRISGPVAASMALAVGALPASVATARFNEVPMTTPMRIGALLLVVGAFFGARSYRGRPSRSTPALESGEVS